MTQKKCLATVLVVGETIDGRLSAGTGDLGRQARQLAGRFKAEPVGVLTGHDIEPVARFWSKTAGMPVIILDHVQCRYPNPHLSASGVGALAVECSPLAVCFPHNLRACQAAASLAWRIKAPCITAVDAFLEENGQWVLSRAVFGGKLNETVSTVNTPMVLTVMPGLFSRSPSPDLPDHSPSVQTRLLTGTDHRFIPQGVDRREHTDQALERAQVIVAAGRGLKGPEHASLVKAAAGMFKHAAVGASRGACDLGWLPHSLQIGETGRTVSPALYLACGISGAPQHLAGIRESRTVVAVNTDPKAAINNLAHYAVTEDLTVFLPVLRERYDQMKEKGDAV
ncbi:electron transfer flavoprotein subunit alpha/FixB family protein [Desulfosarcina sp.]|uniref:electron transfer flavoprotein subunit alpha/FixB family protein n=1 Tax=Desulfosarcina sp. TaxID=2027861 RepID=UPI00356141C8